MADQLPAPLVPPEVDLRGLEWMPLYGNRLFGSDFDAHADDTAFRCGLQLWWSAWNQVPAASLPDDDVALCRLAGLGRDAKTWRRIRAATLRGFLMCSDGRLYHRTLSQWAVQAWDRRRRDRDRKAKWRASQEQGRPADKDGPVTPSVPVSGTAERRGEERRGDSKKEESPLAAASPVVSVPKAAAEDDDLAIPPFLKRTQASMAERDLVDEAFALWTPVANGIGISDVGYLNSTRRAALSQRLAEIGGIEGWKVFLEKVREAEFLRKADGRPKFWVGLGKLLEPEHFSKVLEGRYDQQHRRSDDTDERSTTAALAGIFEAGSR